MELLPQNKEIVGGHNYCRNPAGEEQMEAPWCFTSDRSSPKQVFIKGLINKYFPWFEVSELELPDSKFGVQLN